MTHVKSNYRDKDLLKDPALYAEAQYQQNTVQTNLKTLFSRFSQRGICYKLGRDFNGRGQLQAYWKKVAEICTMYQRDYGRLPNKSTFDPDWYQKRSKAAYDPQNEFDPLNNIEHYTWCCLEHVMFMGKRVNT